MFYCTPFESDGLLPWWDECVFGMGWGGTEGDVKGNQAGKRYGHWYLARGHLRQPKIVRDCRVPDSRRHIALPVATLVSFHQVLLCSILYFAAVKHQF